jgi:hypothetical protein
MPRRTRPIEKFAKLVAKCSAEVSSLLFTNPISASRIGLSFRQAASYGKCIVANYNTVYKDMCVKEFMKLKDCCLVLFLYMDFGVD